MKRSPTHRAGFTLLEIMLVVLIIGLIIGMGVRMVGGRIDEARVTQAKAHIEQFKTSLVMYQARAGSYPTGEQGLDALVNRPTLDPRPRDWVQIEEVVQLDPWGKPYFYVRPGKHRPKDYDLFSAGPDGNPDTEEDNIGNWVKATN